MLLLCVPPTRSFCLSRKENLAAVVVFGVQIPAFDNKAVIKKVRKPLPYKLFAPLAAIDPGVLTNLIAVDYPPWG